MSILITMEIHCISLSCAAGMSQTHCTTWSHFPAQTSALSVTPRLRLEGTSGSLLAQPQGSSRDTQSWLARTVSRWKQIIYQMAELAAREQEEFLQNWASILPLHKHHPVALHEDNDTVPGENSSRLTLMDEVTLESVGSCRVRRLLLSFSYTNLITGVESFSVLTIINKDKLVPLRLLLSIHQRPRMKGHWFIAKRCTKKSPQKKSLGVFK